MEIMPMNISNCKAVVHLESEHAREGRGGLSHAIQSTFHTHPHPADNPVMKNYNYLQIESMRLI